MNQGWIYREQVKYQDVGETVLEYYTTRYLHSSEFQWQARIESGQILLDDRIAVAATELKLGQHLIYHRAPWSEPEVPLSFEVLYEDQDLLVVAKPSGLPVMPGGGFLEHTLLWQLKTRYPLDTPVPIHRLGRGTSGLLLLGRSHLAKSSLSKQMRENTVDTQENRHINNVYHVLIKNNPISDRFTISNPIGKIPHPVLGYVYGATTEGKFARSDCRVMERHRNRTLVEVTILTGRPHQIRIHLAAAGYPLLGDPLYLAGGIPRNTAIAGEKLPVPGDCGYYLHAYQLSFTHPRSFQRMNLECPVPDAWKLVY